MSTKKIISDQVLYRLEGGNPGSGMAVDERDIWKALEQKINSRFLLKHFELTLASGETIPQNTMIATYEGVAVTSMGNGKSKAVLPAQPIAMPKNMGIYLVYDSRFPDNPYIPLQRGQQALLKVDELLNDLMGQIAYEPKNTEVIFTKDITMFGTDEVTMELCVLDITQYGITDRLPIPADYEDELVNELYVQFGGVVTESGLVNNFSNQKPSQ
jgi:hypothetical protein